MTGRDDREDDDYEKTIYEMEYDDKVYRGTVIKKKDGTIEPDGYFRVPGKGVKEYDKLSTDDKKKLLVQLKEDIEAEIKEVKKAHGGDKSNLAFAPPSTGHEETADCSAGNGYVGFLTQAVRLTDSRVSYLREDHRAPGGVMRFEQTYINKSPAALVPFYFQITSLPPGAAVLNARHGPEGSGAEVIISDDILSEGLWRPDASITQVFEVGFQEPRVAPMTIDVDVVGVVHGPGDVGGFERTKLPSEDLIPRSESRYVHTILRADRGLKIRFPGAGGRTITLLGSRVISDTDVPNGIELVTESEGGIQFRETFDNQGTLLQSQELRP